MDINEKQIQINTFHKGMNTDISDSLIGDDQYRMANNLRYITNAEENTGEMHLISGVELIKFVDEKREPIDFGKIIATDSIRDYGVIISRSEEENDGVVTLLWSVYRFTNGSNVATKIFGPCEEPIWDENNNCTISTVCRWESDDNVKLYIADGIHTPSVINISTPYESAKFENINKYSDTAEELTPFRCMLETSGGKLKRGIVLYAYVLYAKNKIQSNISELSLPYIIRSTTSTNDNTENAMYLVLGNVHRFIDDGVYDHIKIYRIHYTSNSTPEINVVYDDKLVINRFDQGFGYTDRGDSVYGPISSALFSTLTGVDIIPKILESKKDILFAANINYVEDSIFPEWEPNGNVLYKFITKQKVIDSNIDNSYVDYNKLVRNSSGEENEILDENVSLRRGEKYRYGIVLYNNKFLKSAVKFIGDILVPEHTDLNYDPFAEIQNLGFDQYRVVANLMGIEFTISNLPEDCIGYEIVRCERKIQNSKTIMSGIISRTMSVNDDQSLYAAPLFDTGAQASGYLYLPSTASASYSQADLWYSPGLGLNPQNTGSVSRSNVSVLLFVSPEILYQADDVQSFLKSVSGLNIRVNGRFDTAGYSIAEQYIPALVTGPFDENGMGGSTGGFNINSYTCANTSTGGIHYTMMLSPDESTKFIGSVGQGVSGTDQSQYYSPNRAFCGGLPADLNHDASYFKYVPTYTIGDSTAQKAQYIEHPQTATITDWKITDTYQNNTFLTSGSSTLGSIKSKPNTINNHTFYNCVVGTTVDKIGNNRPPIDDMQFNHPGFYVAYNTDHNSMYYGSYTGQIISPCGVSLLLSLNNTPGSITASYEPTRMHTLYCDIQNNSPMPYGDKKQSVYESRGNFFIVDDPEAESVSCSVWDGDTFICMHEFVYTHKWFMNQHPYASKVCSVYAFPVETSIYEPLLHGESYSKLKTTESTRQASSWIQIDPINISGSHGGDSVSYSQSGKMYQYNTAYSSTLNALLYTAELETEYNKYDYRVHYSNVKTNNEPVDSWQIFQSADFKDVDTRFGEITQLRLFNDYLTFWQEEAFGVFSINERSLIQDENDTSLVLGTGGVMERYDYLTTTNGMMKNEFSDAQSQNTLYWWDHNKHEIVGYSKGQAPLVISKTKNILNYINTLYLKNQLVSDPELVFDKQNNELVAYIGAGSEEDHLAGSIIHNEILSCFTGLYNIEPLFNIQFKNSLYYTTKTSIYKQLSSSAYATGFDRDDTIVELMPYIKYIVNDSQIYNKVFDITTFGGRFYGGDTEDLDHISLTYKTPLKQEGRIENGNGITNTEYDFRVNIPRAGYIDEDDDNKWKTKEWGDRLRGKTMQVEFKSDTNSTDFSLQYITTKFRISWS